MEEKGMSHEHATAVWVAAFFDELARWGVHDAVISPGSRSTAPAMAAFELSRMRPDLLRVFVDVDERGAAFFGLGLAKATGSPVALICTSGTALANYYPAVMEADASRVPLIVLSGDRPARMQGLGAPQTVDQLKAYGDRVRAFRAMPEPSAAPRDVAFVRQAARELCLAATGRAPVRHAQVASGADASLGELCLAASQGCAYPAGPVHANFPFEEPLKPDFSGGAPFSAGRRAASAPRVASVAPPQPGSLRALEELMASRTVAVFAGEGTCETLAEAREVAAWAHERRLPLIADPLSGLRSVADAAVVDNYDNVFRAGGAPDADLLIRFGRYPVSKHASTWMAAAGARGASCVVVDACETRDFGCVTDVFVPLRPIDFVRAFGPASASQAQHALFERWAALNDEARERIASVETAPEADSFEGAYVRSVMRLAPAGSCVFTANSMAVRALDTFYLKEDKPLCVLCNRGLNGIDGTVSSAFGAAQRFSRTTFLTGDFTLLHDLPALALQREMLRYRGDAAPSIVVVLLNNNGGAIFDMLPQASDDEYFDRLFLAPQDVDFASAAQAFHVPFRSARTVAEFEQAYRACLGVPGISLVEVRTPLRGVKERYAPYQR